MIGIFIGVYIIITVDIDSSIRTAIGLCFCSRCLRIFRRFRTRHANRKRHSTRYARQTHHHRNRQRQRYHFLHKFVPPLILVAYIVNPPFLWYTLF